MKIASKQTKSTRHASVLKSLSTLAVMAVFYGAAPALADPFLGSDLASFAVLGATSVTNVPTSTISGNVGVYAGSQIDGGINFTSGSLQATTPLAASAQGQLTAAITNLGSLGPGITLSNPDLTGLISPGYVGLAPGVYTVSAGPTNLSGALTLDGGGNANAAWVFQMADTLITDSGSVVYIINTGSGAGVYWDVRSSATIGTNSTFLGNILALSSIAMTTGATDLCGRALASTGGVTLDQNTIGGPCAAELGGSTTPTGGGLSGGLYITDTGGVAILPFAPVSGGGTIPEPGSLALLGLGLAALGFARRRQS